MNPLTHKKTFGDIQVDEKLYIIDPRNQNIIAVTVTKSCVHPKSLNKMVWLIETYLPFRLDKITDTMLKEAAKFDTKVTQQFLVEKKLHLCVVLSKIPTVIATEEKYITEWKGKNPLQLILPQGLV